MPTKYCYINIIQTYSNYNSFNFNGYVILVLCLLVRLEKTLIINIKHGEN